MARSTFSRKLIPPVMTAIAVAASVGIGTPAHAYSIFFGEDLGLGENTRLSSTPNSDAARDDFLSNLAGVKTKDFENFVPGSTSLIVINFPGAGTATLQGAGFIANVPTGTNGVGRYPISGNQYFETSSNLSVDFSQEIAAFGFYGVDVGDFSGQITLTLANSGTTMFTVPNTINGLSGSVLYFGVIAENANEVFTSVMFGDTAAGVDIFGFDDFTIGSPEQVQPPTDVPEPASVLGLLTFVALGAGSRLLSKQQQKATVKA